MESQRPLILISNDDGFIAKGINELIRFLRPLAELIVVAPDGPRSGTACSMTTQQPIHYRRLRRDVGLTIYACSGTPTDCIKLALHTLVPRQPDLVVAGINHGDNSSVNVHYSGTMGAVIEGCLKGIPSVGFSLCSHRADADFSPLADIVRRVTKSVLEHGLPPLTCLNVNFPEVSELKGIRVCRQTRAQWINEWEEVSHREEEHHYWLIGQMVELDADDEQTDHWALNNGYAAITPTTVDVTAYALIDELKTWFD